MRSTPSSLATLILLAAILVTASGGERADVTTDLSNRHADLKAGVTSNNVEGLHLAWKIETNTPVTHRPLVEGGVVYFADWGGTVTAADASTGKVLWQKTVEEPKTNWSWHGFCGTGALGEGLVFQASAEGHAVALDAKTGEQKWKVNFVPGEKYAGNCGTILYYDGLVYIGASSVEEEMGVKNQSFKEQFRGRVVALDAKSGREAWILFLCEAPANGVAVWGGFALDPESKTLYFATGNNYSGEATKLSDAIVAVDAKSGKIRWSRQATANDVWTVAKPFGPDYDFPAGPQLFEGTEDGKAHKLVGCGQKSGVYHALDRETGEVVWQAVIGHGEIAGGIMADASVGDGAVFVWSNNSLNALTGTPKDPKMNIKCLDAGTGAPRWVLDRVQPASGTTAAGFLSADVYFVPSTDGRVRGYHAKDGKRLWTSPENEPSLGASLTVVGDTLFTGRGLPKRYGGDEKDSGVYAYRPDRR